MYTRICLIASAALAVCSGAALAADSRPYLGYSGAHWDKDYQILSGHCDRAAIGAVFDGAGGSVLGARAERRENRAAATVIGASMDQLVGRKVGTELDAGDRACIGHTLEIGKAGKHVAWDNLASGVHYQVTPEDARTDIAGLCRRFKVVAVGATGKSKRHGTACEKSPGLWQLTRL
ncbi:MAG TPA: RT0821/Lpp0805 family surface protein [Steroidobacteraceae bacterium]|nr:RT0821/Lpp0805 family surface protein [Steroidobacteraceae bacterium]